MKHGRLDRKIREKNVLFSNDSSTQTPFIDRFYENEVYTEEELHNEPTENSGINNNYLVEKRLERAGNVERSNCIL